MFAVPVEVVCAPTGIEVADRPERCPECGSWNCTLFWPDEGFGMYHCNECGGDFQALWPDEPDVTVEVLPDSVRVYDGGDLRVEVDLSAGLDAREAASRALSLTRLGRLQGGERAVVGWLDSSEGE